MDTKKRILVIEDDKRITEALAIRLEAEGYDVMTASDGFAGMKEVLTERPDLLLMDIWMPVGTGFSVAQRLQNLGLGGIPKIFITASKLRGLHRAATLLGAYAFFEKPYDPDMLLEAVARALAADSQQPGKSAVAVGDDVRSL
jgi:CheY-like chemotaxis protein